VQRLAAISIDPKFTPRKREKREEGEKKGETKGMVKKGRKSPTKPSCEGNHLLSELNMYI
jgi:hypothetical protein